MRHRAIHSVFFALALTAAPVHAQVDSGNRADRGRATRPVPTPTCEIILPPGATEAGFQAPLWYERPMSGALLTLGVVPFEFDANVNPTNVARAIASMQEIMRVCDVEFVPYDSTLHMNWIHIQNDMGTNSAPLGMQGGMQTVRITSWGSNQPNVNFVIVHELLHTLGFWHEHQRADRNDPFGLPVFITVNTPCIVPSSLFNFNVVPGAQLTGAYDFGSVMHYPEWAFSVSFPACPSITALPPNQAWQSLMGQRVMLSQTDIDGLCAHYGCTPVNNTCGTATPVTNGITITDTRGASNSAAGGCAQAQRDVWYFYDAPCTGQVTIALDTPSAGYTPALAVYHDPCGSGAIVACDTTAPLEASFPVTQGERYVVRVGGSAATTGTARLHIACAPINCVTGLQWAQAAATGPGQRRNHAMVYDSSRGRIILFGGVEGITDLGDTWEWDPGTQSWTLRSTTGPSPRQHHALAYDAVRQRVVLFGGYPGLGDTWEYEPIAGVWTLRATTGPLGRWAPGMTYDTGRQRVVMFGGAGPGVGAETWEWDGVAGAWTQPPVVGTVPSGRADFGMAYDANRAVTVMWGGSPTDTSIWEWDGIQWTEFPAAAPAARSGHDLVFAPSANAVLMHGGWAPAPPGFFNDMWSWNGANWTLVGNGVPPVGRAWSASAFDDANDALMVHGGSDGFLQSDTWRALLAGVPNDDPAGATVVGNGSFTVDTRCAADGPAGCAAGRDLWYRYDAAASGSLNVSAAGVSFTPEIAIYDAANPGGPPLACSTGTPAVASMTVIAPGSFLIRVGSAPGMNGGVANLVVNGQPQPCPPVFDIMNFGTFRHRLFEVTGLASGAPWAWSIQRGGTLMFDLDVPGLAPGANAAALAAAFAAAINAHACTDDRLFAVQLTSPYSNQFRVIVGGSTDFSLCVGPAGQLPTCCLPAASSCPFNPDIREIVLSGVDCNANGEDDTIDLLIGNSDDINENGILDDCEVCVGDLDGDGAVGFADLLQVLSAWGPCPECSQDLDADGIVGFEDLLLVLSLWGGC